MIENLYIKNESSSIFVWKQSALRISFSWICPDFVSWFYYICGRENSFVANKTSLNCLHCRSLRDAATVPVAYVTSYYALKLRANLRKGETVLIHCGSSAVGQASIAIALHEGCKVFTTVSTREKRDYLLGRYPQLSEDCFANSRDTSFESHIQRHTCGRGKPYVYKRSRDSGSSNQNCPLVNNLSKFHWIWMWGIIG